MRTMKWLVIVVLAAIPVWTLAGPGEDLGFRMDTEIVEGNADGDICPGTTLLQNDNDFFPNGYCWRFGGVVPPDYGSWAEGYDSDFLCGIQFLFTQTGYYFGQTMDVYVWESNAEGSPPPGPDPGNVICVLPGLTPGPIEMWPDISVHNIQVCCETSGPHYVGFWGNWPGLSCAWFIAADETGPGVGSPRTKVAPGLGFPTGWQHPSVAHPIFVDCKDLGIREFAGIGDCPPTPTSETTWGALKALY